ncbi:MAG: hypothetical protein RL341_1612, partial [Pseudomonadota bacterium]
ATPLHVYCFLQEASGNIQMFFPNRFMRSAKLAPGQSLQLPGGMGFALTAHAEGKREDIVCFGSKTDIAARLPNKGRDFEPVKVASLQELGQIVARANNGSVEAAALAVQGQ